MKKARKIKVLIVDDEQELGAMIAQRLRASGLETHVCADGRCGLEKAKAWFPEVVLIDLSMPDLDGWQLCRALEQDERTASAAKIIMTAWATADLEQRARQAGACRVIVKPFNERLLAGMIRSLARGRRHAAPA